MPENATETPYHLLSHFQKLAIVFAVIGELANLNGRRLDRAYRLSRARLVRPEQGNAARTAKMAPRAERRARVLELREEAKRRTPEMSKQTLRDAFPFRPVYGYGQAVTDHADAVASMKTKNHKTAQRYAERIAAEKAAELVASAEVSKS